MQNLPLIVAVSRVRLALSVLMLALGLAAGAVRAAPEAAFEAAMRHFDAAQTGDAAALEQAVAAIDALRKAEPTNPLLMAYAGAAETLKARTTWLPWKKMNHAEDGLAMQDKALALLAPAHDAPMQRSTPGVLETKLTVASTFLAVPSFMNRGARGEKLLKEVLDSPLLAGSPLPFRGVVWMTAGRTAQEARRSDEARRWYGLVVSQGAPQAAAAQAALKDLAP